MLKDGRDLPDWEGVSARHQVVWCGLSWLLYWHWIWNRCVLVSGKWHVEPATLISNTNTYTTRLWNQSKLIIRLEKKETHMAPTANDVMTLSRRTHEDYRFWSSSFDRHFFNVITWRVLDSISLMHLLPFLPTTKHIFKDNSICCSFRCIHFSGTTSYFEKDSTFIHSFQHKCRWLSQSPTEIW